MRSLISSYLSSFLVLMGRGRWKKRGDIQRIWSITSPLHLKSKSKQTEASDSPSLILSFVLWLLLSTPSPVQSESKKKRKKTRCLDNATTSDSLFRNSKCFFIAFSSFESPPQEEERLPSLNDVWVIMSNLDYFGTIHLIQTHTNSPVQSTGRFGQSVSKG